MLERVAGMLDAVCLTFFVRRMLEKRHLTCRLLVAGASLCSHCGWLLLKCSAIGIGFNGAETNCEIAHILGILLMNSYEIQICSEAIFI